MVELPPKLIAENFKDWQILIPLTPAIIWWLKEKLLRERDPNPKNWHKYEIHHKKPRYKGGKDKESNLAAVTRVEHAQEHYKSARQAKNNKDRKANDWAVRQIVSRMTDDERDEFNDWVSKFHRRK